MVAPQGRGDHHLGYTWVHVDPCARLRSWHSALHGRAYVHTIASGRRRQFGARRFPPEVGESQARVAHHARRVGAGSGSMRAAACVCCACACNMCMQGPCPTMPPWGPIKPKQPLHAPFGAIFIYACRADGGRCRAWREGGRSVENQMGTRVGVLHMSRTYGRICRGRPQNA